jgi:Protein of unknown function (DUF3179)
MSVPSPGHIVATFARSLRAGLLSALLLAMPGVVHAQAPSYDDLRLRLLALQVGQPDAPSRALQWLDTHWQHEWTPYVLDVVRFVPQRALAQQLFELLARKEGPRDLGEDWASWMRWQWSRPPPPRSYAAFKAELHGYIDPRFERYFAPDRPALIRLDEVVWGGVRQDGIPPLREPKMLAARDARYLADGDVVFGVEINGDARAYPKRILAWHEMFVDRVGDVDVAGVYCTLCGAVIIYETRVGDHLYRLGTSGFLYRSNKLMYDTDTQSLWNTLEGRPVIGPLVNQGISLETREVVTTTWGEWRARHPGTTVLSLDTGHRRDYDEGAAYREYFATDALMFPVPETDARLANKQEVLIPRFGTPGEKPLAIASDYLRANPVWHGKFGGRDFVVLTDRTGAHRIYGLPRGERVQAWDRARGVTLMGGKQLSLTERSLGDDPRRYPRLPAHNAFWFGWRAAHPDTLLVASGETPPPSVAPAPSK